MPKHDDARFRASVRQFVDQDEQIRTLTREIQSKAEELKAIVDGALVGRPRFVGINPPAEDAATDVSRLLAEVCSLTSRTSTLPDAVDQALRSKQVRRYLGAALVS